MQIIRLGLTKILIFSMLMFSCTSLVRIDKTLPPEIQTGYTNPETYLVNCFDYSIRGAVREKYQDAFRRGVQETLNSLKHTMARTEELTIVSMDTLIKGSARFDFGQEMSMDSVKSLCALRNANLLLVLETMDVAISNEAEVNENSDGSKSKTQNFFLEMRAGLSLYNKEGYLLHRDYVPAKIFLKSRPTLIAAIVIFEPGLKKEGPKIKELADEIAEDYNARFLPQQVNEYKRMYLAKEFKPIRPVITAQNWDKAIEATIPFTKSSNPDLVRKAAYNLSVLYEITGDLERTNYWTEIANKK
jgi:hypothetical protein